MIRGHDATRGASTAAQWKQYQDRHDPSRLVFIDETWAKTNMTRTHGWRTGQDSNWQPKEKSPGQARAISQF